jgi:hypothetical protein
VLSFDVCLDPTDEGGFNCDDPFHPVAVTLSGTDTALSVASKVRNEINGIDALGSGSLSPFTGATPLSLNQLPLRGELRLCLLDPSCTNFLAVSLSANSGGTAVGVGGTLSASTPSGIRVSLANAPWTVGQAMALDRTDSGALATLTETGFVHGPASLTSTAGADSGVLQIVTPVQVRTTGLPGSNDTIAAFGTLQLQLVPEPGSAAMLLAGAVVLVLLGWRRRR